MCLYERAARLYVRSSGQGSYELASGLRKVGPHEGWTWESPAVFIFCSLKPGVLASRLRSANGHRDAGFFAVILIAAS